MNFSTKYISLILIPCTILFNACVFSISKLETTATRLAKTYADLDNTDLSWYCFIDQSVQIANQAGGSKELLKTLRMFVKEVVALTEIKSAILAKLRLAIGKDAGMATRHDWYKAAALALRDRIVHRWLTAEKMSYDAGRKRVYYLSLEFLIGRLLHDALTTWGWSAACVQRSPNWVWTMTNCATSSTMRRWATAGSDGWRRVSWRAWRRSAFPRSATARRHGGVSYPPQPVEIDP